MLRYATYLLVFISLVAGGLTPALATKRVALVIGNSVYESAPTLKNPINDADAISAVLTKLGFEVVKGIDLTHVDFASVVSKFRKKLKGADVGLFFYAGHGLQVNGSNYLAPVDAELDDETALDFEAVPLRLILSVMERSTKTNLVFLDACRDNPLARNLARGMGTRSTAIGTGLARVESGLGTLITFATQPGNVALDGDGKNSPFATGMLKHMETPGLDVALVMRRVREEVIKATSGSQIPWSNSSLTGSFIFNDKLKEELKPVASPAIENTSVELAFWQAAKDDGTRETYEAYLSKYPKGNFSPLAAIKLKAFSKFQAKEAKQKSELEAAKKKQTEAEKAKRNAEAKQRTALKARDKKKAAKEAAKRKADADRRQQELADLEKKQAAERESLAREREELDQQLKALEERAKKRAVAKKEKEQKMASLQPPEQQPKTDSSALPLLDAHTMVLVLQNELKRVGCDPGKVDGKWGKKGRTALANFNVYAKLKLPTATPSMEALEAVKGSKERVCPLICGPQFNKTGDQCVKKTCRSGQKLSKRGQCIKVVAKKKITAPKKPKTVKKKKKKSEPELCWTTTDGCQPGGG